MKKILSVVGIVLTAIAVALILTWVTASPNDQAEMLDLVGISDEGPMRKYGRSTGIAFRTR